MACAANDAASTRLQDRAEARMSAAVSTAVGGQKNEMPLFGKRQRAGER
jgi:hypothetical protein